jgi:two-component system sensor histidine kinase DegS
MGLIPSLELLISEIEALSSGKLDPQLIVNGTARRLLPETELVLFRVAQEALHNIRRHAHATQVVLRVKFRPTRVILSVMDDGRGFDYPDELGYFAEAGKLGMIGMRERVRLIDGKFMVKSRIGKGTVISVVVETK